MNLWYKLVNTRFILFTIILALKGSLAWYVVFGTGLSWETFATEIPFFWVIFCLIEWFAKRRKVLYYMIANFILTLLFFSVLMYYKYYGIIATYHALKQADKVTKVGNSTYSLMDPYYLLIFIDIFVLAAFLIWGARKNKKSQHKVVGIKPLRKSVVSVVFVLSVMLCVFNIWPNKASMNENKKAEEMGILNYEVYTILSDTTEEEEWVEMEDITQDEINRLKGIREPVVRKYEGVAVGKNLIIIQMESFQNFLIGLEVDGKEITPNMNKLAAGNIHFNHFYATVGQGTTSDAEFTVNTSLYVPKHEPATDNYVNKALPSLPKLLSAQGYNTATFHTNAVDFWNRYELYSAIGFDRYYDQQYFGDEDHVAFGASDDVLYSKTFDKLQEMDVSDEPFYAHVISMSSHHPYTIPEDKVLIDLPDAYDDTLVGRYLQAQNFADHALGKFIDNLRSSGLWDNSVVVLYGDHQGLPLYSLDQHEKSLMESMVGHKYGYTDMFNIPLIVHIPGITQPQVLSNTGGQVDVLPTVANLLGISLDEQIHFGEDLFNQTYNMLPMRHFLPTGSVFTDRKLFLPGIAYEDGENYPLPNIVGETLDVTEEEYNNTLELLRLSDSYVPQLPDKDPNVRPKSPTEE